MEAWESLGPEFFSLHLRPRPSSPGLRHSQGLELNSVTQRPLVPSRDLPQISHIGLGDTAELPPYQWTGTPNPPTRSAVTVTCHQASAQEGWHPSHSFSPSLKRHIGCILPAVWPWAITSPLCLSFPTYKMDLIMGSDTRISIYKVPGTQ